MRKILFCMILLTSYASNAYDGQPKTIEILTSLGGNQLGKIAEIQDINLSLDRVECEKYSASSGFCVFNLIGSEKNFLTIGNQVYVANYLEGIRCKIDEDSKPLQCKITSINASLYNKEFGYYPSIFILTEREPSDEEDDRIWDGDQTSPLRVINKY